MDIKYDNVGWVHIQDRKVLCNRSHNSDIWFIPGGKREKDEDDKQVLTREMKEELSVDILPKTIAYLKTFQAQAAGKPPDTFIQLACYTAEFTGELAPANEIAEILWLSYADKDETSPVSQLVIEYLKEKNLID